MGNNQKQEIMSGLSRLLVVALVATAVLGALGAPFPVPHVLPHPHDNDIETHDCVHDHHIEQFKARHGGKAPYQPTSLPINGNVAGSRKLLQAAAMRFHVDVQFLDNDAGFTCYTVGEIVSVGNPGMAGPDCNEDDGPYDDCYLTCEAKHVYSASVGTYLEDLLLPEATAFLSQALAVDPIANLNFGGGTLTCGASNPITIPSDPYQTTGVDNVEFVFFVTARPTVGTLLAYASPCLYDSGTGRPIAAHVNFGPNKISDLATISAKQRSVAIHEIMHALGFTYDLFPDYVGGGGVKANVITDVVIGSSAPQYTQEALYTPAVLAEARAHFGCPTLAGMPLENIQQSGTGGSHWEKRVAWREMMAGSSSDFPEVSRMTLGAFEDTGWYAVNYSVAEPPFAWGKDEGCAFVEERCNSWDDEYLCDTNGDSYCSFDREFRGLCQIGTYNQDLPTEYQYFADPRLGGYDALSDYCPIVVEYSNGACQDPANGEDTDVNYGAVHSDLAGCFSSSLIHVDFISVGDNVRCHRWACDEDNTMMILIGNEWMACAEPEATLTSSFYQGSLTCPDANFIDTACGGINHEAEITSVDPAEVSQGGGEQVTITGSGFLSGVAYVDVAGIACESWEVLSDTEIDCTTASFDGWVDSGNSDAHVVTGGRSWHRGAGVVELDAAMGVVPSLLAVVVAACAAVAMAIL